MCESTGQIVRALAGRDKDGLFCVIGEDREGRLLLADGKRRKFARPKPKKAGHLQVLAGCPPEDSCPAIRKLRQGEPLTDKELRRTLRAFRDEMEA